MNKRVIVSIAYICFSTFIMWLVYTFTHDLLGCFATLLLILVFYGIINSTFIESKKEKIIYDMPESEIIKRVKENDENFSKENFYIFVKNIIHFFYDARMGENLDKIKSLVSESVYTYLNNMILTDKSNGLDRIIVDLEIKGVVLKNYYVKDDYEFIEVLTDYRYNDFTLKQATQEINDVGKYRFVKYIYTFSRKIGNHNKLISYKNNCPGCGANNCNFVMGVCVRCGYMVGNYGDFILESIVGVKDE